MVGAVGVFVVVLVGEVVAIIDWWGGEDGKGVGAAWGSSLW